MNKANQQSLINTKDMVCVCTKRDICSKNVCVENKYASECNLNESLGCFSLQNYFTANF